MNNLLHLFSPLLQKISYAKKSKGQLNLFELQHYLTGLRV